MCPGCWQAAFFPFSPSQSFYFWVRQQQPLWAGGACLAWSLQPVWSCSGAPGWVFLRVIKAIWGVIGAMEATPNCTRHSLDLESIVASFLTYFSQISLWKERMLLRHLPCPETDVCRGVCVFLYTCLSRHSAVPAFADLEADTKLWPPPRFPDYFQESSRVSGQKWGSCVLPARIIKKYCPRAALERRVAGKSSGAASFTTCHWVNWDLFASWMLRPVSGASHWK